jgi:hypothetical protein
MIIAKKREIGKMSNNGIGIIGYGILAAVAVVAAICTVTTVDADEIVIKQSAFDGDLTVWTDPGPHMSNFGKLTRYKKSTQYSFTVEKDDKGQPVDHTIRVRFNDGGHGNVAGSFRYDLPLDAKNMLAIHKTLGAPEVIDTKLVGPAIERAVYMSGPLMSSKESSGERRADLLNYIEDQTKLGVYRTTTTQEKATDDVTGKEKTIARVEILKSDKGAFLRQESSPLERFGIHVYSFSVNIPYYEADVEKQIKEQQSLTMQVQTAMARSKQAEQMALTVVKEGEASAAKARADQEILKATEVTKAEQEKAVAITNAQRKKEVAQLDVETAKLKKEEQILLGEGEASRASAMMHATGYLPERLDAFRQVALVAAEQLGKQRQTPDIVMGSGSGQAGLSDLMQMSLAKQFGVDRLK